MAEKKIIAAKLEVDTSSIPPATKDVKLLKEEVKSLEKEFQNAKQGSKEQADIYKRLQSAQGELRKSTGGLTDDIKGSTGHFSNLKDKIAGLPGPAGQAVSGVNSLGTAFKALLANPVGLVLTAIVAVLALLWKAFTNTFEGAQKVERIFASVKAAAQSLFDNLDKIASSIIKIFKFDFSGAIADMKAIGDAAVEAFNKTNRLTKELQEIKQRDLEGDVDDAKRKARLADLKEELQSEETSFKRKREIAQELKKDAQYEQTEGIKDDRRRIEIQIELLKMQKDGAKKNAEEISQLQIELINTERERSQEVIAINKQLKAIDRQEEAERKERAAKAREEEKAAMEKLVAFRTQLSKLQQENELLGIKDSYAREQAALEQKIANDKAANEKAFQERRLTRQQYLQIESALEIQANLQRQSLMDKHNDELKKKEEDFQKELSGIRTKISLAGITDARQLERTQLQLASEERLNEAIKRYKDDQDKLNEVKAALDEQSRLEQKKLEDKFKLEDDKKKLDEDIAKQQKIVEDKQRDYDERIAAIDAEQELFKAALDNKLITEQEYNAKVDGLAQARMAIAEQEAQHKQRITAAISTTLNTAADLAGRQTALGKTLAIAATAINTYQAGFAAFKGMVSTIPGPVGIAAGVIAAAGAVAAGIDAVKKIVSVQVPGGGGGGAVPSAPAAPAAPIAPQQQGVKLDQESINATGNVAEGGVNRNNRAYVLGIDIQNDADRNARLERAARLGG